jgi:molybdate/tungstate transport system substrate-binding protein
LSSSNITRTSKIVDIEGTGISLVLILILLLVILYTSNGHRWAVLATTANNTEVSLVQQGGQVFVMYAASLLKTFEESLGPAFQTETGYSYHGEPKGSVQISNMILDGLRRPDFFVSAGTIPVKKLMEPTDAPPLAEWLVKFGSAEMVIAYSPNSPFFSELEKARLGKVPWYEVLSKPDLKFGRTDSELDPKGYYMIITAELANRYYNDSEIKQKILGEDRNPEQIFPEETLKTILEQGQLDAVAAYKHEAVARGLPYITLPLEINLSDPTFSSFYKTGSYILGKSGNRTEGQTAFGEPIYFSFTIPNTVENLNGAISFASFILSTNGKNILEEQGLNYIKPIIEGNKEKIPSALKNVLGEKELMH